MGKKIKTLTLRQPWAGLVMSGAKPIENRTWRPSLTTGERFAIHAGKTLDEWPPFLDERLKVSVPDLRGMILGTVELVGVHDVTCCTSASCEAWGMPGARFHWELADPIFLESPVRAGGKLGLWSASLP